MPKPASAKVKIKLSRFDSTRKQIRTLTGHSQHVLSVISPDGQTSASGGGDNNVKLWEAPTGKLFSNSYSGHTESVRATFSPDKKTLVVVGIDVIKILIQWKTTVHLCYLMGFILMHII